MRKNTKKVDKAQARILFLILIVVMFFGQAVYDYLRKKSRRSGAVKPVKRTQVSRQRPKPQPDAQPGLPGRMAELSKRLQTAAREEEPAAISGPAERPEPSELSELSDKSDLSDRSDKSDLSDLRRAVIWSEILKRKF